MEGREWALEPGRLWFESQLGLFTSYVDFCGPQENDVCSVQLAPGMPRVPGVGKLSGIALSIPVLQACGDVLQSLFA
jgi:hypothetical protein